MIWPQEDGYVPQDILEAPPLATTVHRIWECESTKEERAVLAPTALLKLAEETDVVGMAAFEKAILPALTPLIPPPSANSTFIWEVRPAGGAYQGTIYTDGSRIDGPDPSVARKGWSFVVQNATAARWQQPTGYRRHG